MRQFPPCTIPMGTPNTWDAPSPRCNDPAAPIHFIPHTMRHPTTTTTTTTSTSHESSFCSSTRQCRQRWAVESHKWRTSQSTQPSEPGRLKELPCLPTTHGLHCTHAPNPHHAKPHE